MILSGNTIYGTASGWQWGVSVHWTDPGTLFAVSTDGAVFTGLYTFPRPLDAPVPQGSLILSGNTLYGTAKNGGSSGEGAVFRVNTDGTEFTTLYGFTAINANANSDGAYPNAGLILSGNTLYGTAEFGGYWGWGSVFAVNTDGIGFTNLHSFTDVRSSTNSGGESPLAGLILSGNTLYGTAWLGGSSGNGTVFAVNTDGTGFMVLHSFSGFDDGSNPKGGLLLSGNTLYGTTAGGGNSGNGTLFAINTDGTDFRNLYSFSAVSSTTNSDGAHPAAGLILSGNTLYGTAQYGGAYGNGTIFSLSLGSASPPQLTLVPSGASIILAWPTNAAVFTLQSAPAMTSTFTNIPGATSPYTNALTAGQQFFRLISN